MINFIDFGYQQKALPGITLGWEEIAKVNQFARWKKLFPLQNRWPSIIYSIQQ